MEKTNLRSKIAIVFAGGLGLGAYQAGAFQRFQEDSGSRLDWLAGSSVGAVNAALIAGNLAAHRIARLREFWSEPALLGISRLSQPPGSRYARNWLSALHSRLLGASGHFRPRAPGFPFEDFKSFYD